MRELVLYIQHQSAIPKQLDKNTKVLDSKNDVYLLSFFLAINYPHETKDEYANQEYL